MKNELYLKIVNLLLTIVAENGRHAVEARLILRDLLIEVK